jgi:dihydroorotate dehydrogenase
MLIDVAASLLRRMPAEPAHRATIALTKTLGTLLPRAADDDPRLRVDVLGLSFPNPIGLAAGFDKDAEVPDAMLRLGFGFVECGTVTPLPQGGNSKPRMFRLAADRAVINRMGFNNEGAARAALRLAGRKRRGIVGINIGANKDSADRIADYVTGFRALAHLSDYVTVNVSSPNTPGLRGLQNRAELEQLLAKLAQARQEMAHPVPLLLKIAPDLDAKSLDDIAAVVLELGMDGMIISNTTVMRPDSLKDPNAREQGGLSGRPLFELSTQILLEMRKRVGNRIVLIGAGGVSSGADAYAKVRAGASLVQLYTALALEGPGLVMRIKQELLELMLRDGFASLSDAVGSDAR